MITKSLSNKITKLLLVILGLGLSFSLSSCATGAYSTYDYDYSISDIQKAVSENLPQGIGSINGNRRVFYSKKFTINQEKKGRIPLIMRVDIRGERRPYSLFVEVKRVPAHIDNIEEAYENGENFEGQESLAKRVVTRIEDALAQRRKNKNLFDDFRPF